ncbi:MAG: FHA domain-containing protein, partial [Bdellovibrionia bacterium]
EVRFEEEIEVKKPVPLVQEPPAVDEPSNPGTMRSAVTLSPNTNQNEVEFNEESFDHTPAVLEDDKTSIGTVNAVPFVRVFNSKTQKTMDIKLDGAKWKAGRAPECQIVLDEGAASRQHFEILKTNSGFQLRDLGSSNGTRVNGNVVDEMTTIVLNSGDIIAIGGTTIEFQVRDTQFAARLQQAGIVPYTPQDQGLVPAGSRVEVMGAKRKKGFKMKPIHGAIGGIFAFILIVSMFGPGDKQPDPGDPIPPGPGVTESASKRLTAAQLKYVEDTYKLAEDLFKRQKYEASLIELKKVHELTESHKRSRELETYAEQAISIKNEQNEMERQREEQERLREANMQIVEECRAKNFKSSEQVEACLSPVTENDPENADAAALIAKIQGAEEKRRAEKEAETSFNNDIKELTNLFNKAASQEKAGQLLNAIGTYDSVAKSGLSDPKGFKPKAKAKVKELQGSIQGEIKKAQQKASEFASQEKFRDALNELQRALDLDPENANAKAQFDKVYKDLNKRLKTIYGDSVLEESLGNVEAAKQKWNSILEMDLETGEYYQKSKRMLKKYGG